MTKTVEKKVKSINVVILAIGRVELEGGLAEFPICLSEIGGLSVLESIINKADSLENANFTFVFSADDTSKYHLDKISQILKPGSISFRVPETTKGSLCTSLSAVSTLEQNSELLIISANELVNINFNSAVESFRSNSLDGGTLVFKSIQPRYSYVRLGDDGYVSEAAQRRPISQDATAGMFWFSKTSDFVAGAKSMIRKDAVVDGAFFIAPVFNELILEGKKIGISRIEVNDYRPLKTKKQIDLYESDANHEK